MVPGRSAVFSNRRECSWNLLLLREGHDLLAAIPDARSKDGGWEPAIVSMLLNGIEITTLPEWLIRDLELKDLQDFLQRLRLATAELALSE